jgi:5-methylcytosine-specific restriction protein A
MSGDGRLSTRQWRRLRLLVLDRDLWLCQVNGPGGKHHATEVDHIVPRGQGGDFWDPSNLRAACRPCNLGRREPTGGRQAKAGAYRTRF